MYRRLTWSKDWNELKFLQQLLHNPRNRILPEAKHRIFAFWTGDNPMSENRKHALRTFLEYPEIPFVLVTPKNLQEYILQDHPLPKEFKFLSNVHKSDYLRCYFMYYYGGGYCDIKPIRNSWKSAFEILNANNDKDGLGYTEIPTGVGYVYEDDEHLPERLYNLNYEMQCNYKKLIGNCAYIFKPGSLIFEILLDEQERRVLISEKNFLNIQAIF